MRRKPNLARLGLVLLGICLVTPALARTERRKAFVDGILQRMMTASEKAAREHGRPEAIGRDELAYFARQAAVDARAQVPAVRVRLQLDAGARQEVERLGIRTYGRMDGFASALIPIPRLAEIQALPGVIRMQAVKVPKLEIDAGRVDVRANQVESAYGAHGRGVIYGSVDSGIDWRQPDFIKPDGMTRIKYLWNQDDACVGTPPAPPFDFGCLWTEADINAALTGGPAIDGPDGDGHGTHTTGVGAGNGRATGNGYPAERYVGMAREADIIFVKTFPEPNDADGQCATCYDLSAGMDFIDTMAASLGRPYVINLSLGLQYGGHDGSDLDELTIDTLTGPGIPGKAVVKSAGNERGHAIHISGTAVAGVTNSHTFNIPIYTPIPGIFNDTIAWSVWYSDGDILTVTIADPPAAPCGGSTLTLSATTGMGQVVSNTNSGFMIIDDTASPAPNGGRFFDMEVDDQGTSAPCRGTWTLRVTGNTITAGGRYDAWIWYSTFGINQIEALWTAPDDTRTLSVPATAFNTTAVGAHTSKTTWLSVDGNTYEFTGGTPLGALTSFSSPGPTRDGRIKPDLSAPGSAIVSSLSSDAAPFVQVPLIAEDGVHWSLPGTSFSSPIVAGVYAQMLELNPNLDAIDLRTLATGTARVDVNVTPPLPNNDWGHGKLDAGAMAGRAVNLVPDMTSSPDGTFSWEASPTATSYNVYRGNLSLKAPGYYGSCFLPGLVTPSFTDPAVPVDGDGYFYLSTGVWNGIEGILGYTSDGTLRLNASPCP